MLIAENGAPLLQLVWDTDSIPRILLHDCHTRSQAVARIAESTASHHI